MISLFEAAWVIARRDFVATVWSRSFIFFLVTPLIVMAFSLFAGQMAGRADRDLSQPVVALATDGASVEALQAARSRLVGRMSERSFPTLRRVDRAENVSVQARQLLADEEQGLSALFTGTIERPVLIGPARVDDFVIQRMTLLIEEAQRDAVIEGAAPDFRPVQVTRDVTSEAAGNLREIRLVLARGGQFVIFFLTLLLATLLLSNLIEEKSNKVIEVLAAAVPLDAVFLGKLVAMLGISLVGLAVWGGMVGLAALLSVQLMPGFQLPQIAPAVGWPAYLVLLFVYYTTNYMLLGSLFLGIGGQAASIREVQTLNMPITFLQLMVLLLASTVVGGNQSLVAWAAYIFPFSSPLAMIATAAESPSLWPHLVAILWQALWVVLTIRIAAALFRKTVLKSGGKTVWLPKLRLGKAR